MPLATAFIRSTRHGLRPTGARRGAVRRPDAGRAAGEIRAEISAEDFLTRIGALWRIAPADPFRINGMLDIIIAGIC